MLYIFFFFFAPLFLIQGLAAVRTVPSWNLRKENKNSPKLFVSFFKSVSALDTIFYFHDIFVTHFHFRYMIYSAIPLSESTLLFYITTYNFFQFSYIFPKYLTCAEYSQSSC